MKDKRRRKPRGSSHLVSIIMPVYNGENFLDIAISSVVNQSYKNWELILVNDGSTDKSPEILSRWACVNKRIVVESQANAGQSVARNRGAEVAQGKFLTFLDQDDYYHKDALRYLVELFDENDEIGMAYNDVEVIDEEGGRLYNHGGFFLPPPNSPPKSLVDCISADLLILPGSVMIRRDLFLAVGGYDRDLIGYEDDHLFVRLFRITKFARTYKAGLFYRMHSNNTSGNFDRMCRSRELFHGKIRALLKDNLKFNINFSYAITRRCLICLLAESRTARIMKDKKGIRDIYRSGKTYDWMTTKLRMASCALHPWIPYTLIRIVYRLARIFGINI